MVQLPVRKLAAVDAVPQRPAHAARLGFAEVGVGLARAELSEAKVRRHPGPRGLLSGQMVRLLGVVAGAHQGVRALR